VRRSIHPGCLLFVAVLLLCSTGLSRAENHGEGDEERYAVVLAFDKGSPSLGTNLVRITVSDSSSAPVKGARVKVNYFMPSLRGKPPMMGRSVLAKAAGDVYEATLKLTMKGEWRVIVSVETPAGTEETAFAYEIG
jgi:hypothetical protein